jgi:DNA-directed RNA polymerase subunit omega
MARVTIEDCLKVVPNRFLLVHIATKRARQLMKGSKPLVEGYKNREVVMALREIAAGKVKWTEKEKGVKIPVMEKPRTIEITPEDLEKEGELLFPDKSFIDEFSANELNGIEEREFPSSYETDEDYNDSFEDD